jgi:hypothetical protein
VRVFIGVSAHVYEDLRIYKICVSTVFLKKNALQQNSCTSRGAHKIKPAQSFGGAHKDRVCVRVFI